MRYLACCNPDKSTGISRNFNELSTFFVTNQLRHPSPAQIWHPFPAPWCSMTGRRLVNIVRIVKTDAKERTECTRMSYSTTQLAQTTSQFASGTDQETCISSLQTAPCSVWTKPPARAETKWIPLCPALGHLNTKSKPIIPACPASAQWKGISA